jgi:hypothetical protein
MAVHEAHSSLVNVAYLTLLFSLLHRPQQPQLRGKQTCRGRAESDADDPKQSLTAAVPTVAKGWRAASLTPRGHQADDARDCDLESQ